jgi:MFS family permease
MIPLSLSFISKSISAPSTRTILTQLCALQPSKVAATVIPSQSIPFTLLSAFAIAVSYADRSNLSTAIIPMSETYHWDSFFSGVVLSAFWGGYGLTQIIGGKLADKFFSLVLLFRTPTCFVD